MLEATLPPPSRTRLIRLDWVGLVFAQPRRAFALIASETGSLWQTPLLILSLSAILTAAAAGWLRGQAAASGELQLPPDFQYYNPEQQAQILKALEATASPVFLYLFPGVLALVTVWLGWLLTAGLLHFALTLLGGRGAVGTSLNLVGWAGLPLVARDLVRTAAMVSTGELIALPGLSGFVTVASGSKALFLSSLLSYVDVYLLWLIVLIVIGARRASDLPLGKSVLAVVGTLAAILLVRAALAAGTGYLGSLTIARPFFF